MNIDDTEKVPLRRSLRMRPKAAAKVLQLSESLLEKWRAKGCGPKFEKVGRKVYYDVIELEAFRAAYEHGQAPSSPFDVAPL